MYPLHVSCIDDLNRLDQLKEAWDTVYAADPHATIFLSWAWLRGWFETMPYNWRVLAVQPDSSSSYIAFLGLSIEVSTQNRKGDTGPVHIHSHPLRHSHLLRMGGNPLADYTGFVCLPGFEAEALNALAVYVQQHLEWDIFQMKDIFDPRWNFFIKCFPDHSFTVKIDSGTVCPYIRLPGDWNDYMKNFLGSATRQGLARKFRTFKRLENYGITEIDESNLMQQVDTLLMLWQMRWGKQPGHVLNQYRAILSRCFENHCLWLTILRDGCIPIVGMAAFIDAKKKTFRFYITGFDEKFSRLSPGRVMVGYSIRWAIEKGFLIYDFMRGDEPYKYSFGALKRFNTNITICRKNL